MSESLSAGRASVRFAPGSLPAQFVRVVLTRLRKRLRLGHSLDELNPDLAGRELLFRAPPLSAELRSTIKRISPQFHLKADENSRRFWELNQNGLSWSEYLVLKPVLLRLGKPSRVLDIGPGLGRSTVFFKKAQGWNDVPFDLFEGSGDSTKYTQAGPRFGDSFCSDLDLLELILRFNEIEQFEILDAHLVGARLGALAETYDFVYSFFAVGFHWTIDSFLEEILQLLSERGIGAFTLHERFNDTSCLASLPHRIVRFPRSWPRNGSAKMLILARDEELLADVGEG